MMHTRTWATAAIAIGIASAVVSGCGDDSDCSDGSCTSAGGAGHDTGAPSTATSATHASGSSATQATGATASVSSSGGMSSGSSMDEAVVNLTFSGCSPSFTGDLVVASSSDSVAVSTIVAPISNIQFDLHETSGSITLSTAQRVATGDVINLVTSNTTWTNVSTQQPDTISGTLTIHHYEEQAGILDLAFSNVVLENVQDHGLCTINGTLTTTGTSF